MEENIPWFVNLVTVMEKIAGREEYSSSEAARIAKRIPDIHPLLRSSFLQWLETGKIDETIEISGYTINKLATLHGRKAVTASYIILSELQKDLEKGSGDSSSSSTKDEWLRWDQQKLQGKL